MEEKRLTRSQDEWIAGICGGIAQYFGWDKDLTRIIWLLLTLFTAGFPGIIAYIVLLILMPKE